MLKVSIGFKNVFKQLYLHKVPTESSEKQRHDMPGVILVVIVSSGSSSCSTLRLSVEILVKDRNRCRRQIVSVFGCWPRVGPAALLDERKFMRCLSPTAANPHHLAEYNCLVSCIFEVKLLIFHTVTGKNFDLICTDMNGDCRAAS